MLLFHGRVHLYEGHHPNQVVHGVRTAIAAETGDTNTLLLVENGNIEIRSGGERITVAAPYFNKAVLPIMVAIVWLMAIGPVVPWRKTNIARLRRLMFVPVCVAALFLALGMLVGALRDAIQPA